MTLLNAIRLRKEQGLGEKKKKKKTELTSLKGAHNSRFRLGMASLDTMG